MSIQASQHDPDHLPKPPQFGLRTMFYGVAACGACLAVFNFLGPVYGTIVAWFVLLIAAHVVANMWGTRMKTGRAPLGDPELGRRERPAASNGVALVPSTRLGDRFAIGWLMIFCAVIGAAIGGVAGSYGLIFLNGSKLGAAGLILGGGSSAVIGGFLGFLASSFLEVSHRAWQHGWDRWQRDLPAPAAPAPKSRSWLRQALLGRERQISQDRFNARDRHDR